MQTDIHTIPVFERAKTVHASERAVTVIGVNYLSLLHTLSLNMLYEVLKSLCSLFLCYLLYLSYGKILHIRITCKLQRLQNFGTLVPGTFRRHTSLHAAQMPNVLCSMVSYSVDGVSKPTQRILKLFIDICMY
jgi:hypothetical protein